MCVPYIYRNKVGKKKKKLNNIYIYIFYFYFFQVPYKLSFFLFLFFFKLFKVEMFGCTIGRILIRNMGVDGSAWRVQILGVFSLILKEPSSTLNWRLSISSSSKGLLLPPLTDAKPSYFFCKARQKMRKSACTTFFLKMWCWLKWNYGRRKWAKVQK